MVFIVDFNIIFSTPVKFERYLLGISSPSYVSSLILEASSNKSEILVRLLLLHDNLLTLS